MSLEKIEDLEKGKLVNVYTITGSKEMIYEGKIEEKCSFIKRGSSNNPNILSWRISPFVLEIQNGSILLNSPYKLIIYQPSDSNYNEAKEMLEKENLWGDNGK